jgi:poly-gamma-glutamate capsule biosynthesis protein CapA/YwtB (metallophosphatase superfamily)
MSRIGQSRLRWVVASFFVVAAFGLLSAQAPNQPPPRAKTPAAAASPAADTSTSIVLTGDTMITQRLSVFSEPQFMKMVELIRGGDAAFTNLEMLLHDFEPYPMTESGGNYLRADPFVAKELVWAGIDLVAGANNHTNDYGVDGMRLTMKHATAAGLIEAGGGETLEEAREAKYFDTAKGRVALISVASTYPDGIRASSSWGDTKARPGLSPLRYTTTNVVTREQFDTLRAAMVAIGRARSGGEGTEGGSGRAADSNQMNVFGNRFVVGDRQVTRTEPHKGDLEQIARVVKGASGMADYTIVAWHGHENGVDRFTPPDFVVTFARAMIDAGADIVAGNGPHILRGIEIYKGKPIFYSLGNFMFQNETIQRLPPENSEGLGLPQGSQVVDYHNRRYNFDKQGFPVDPYIWESVIAVPKFNGKTLTELKLYPISIGFGKPRTERGRPMMADTTLSKKIVDDMIKYSEPFGTKIEFKDGIGVVALAK